MPEPLQVSLSKKSLGQHWLNDDISLEAMCDAAELGSADCILEIGPGQGSLTQKLLNRGAQVTAVELDETLIRALSDKFRGQSLSIVTKDILKFDFTSLPAGYKVVANIPYYLTSNLLRVLCEASNPFSQAALLVQKEVAERVAAAPGQMSLLSVSVQFYCQVGLGPTVLAKLFEPPPKVDSQILLLEHSGPRFTDVQPEKFFRLVKAGFSERRKKLRSSLSGGLRLSKPETEDLLRDAGINPDLRAQELSLEDWHKLYLTVNKT